MSKYKISATYQEAIDKYNNLENKENYNKLLLEGYKLLNRIENEGYEFQIIDSKSKKIRYTTKVKTKRDTAKFNLDPIIDFKLAPIIENWNLTEQTKLFISFFKILTELSYYH